MGREGLNWSEVRRASSKIYDELAEIYQFDHLNPLSTDSRKW